MTLRLICGRSGSGKSNFCFDEIVEKINDNNKIYIITPEQFSFTAEKKLMEKIKSGATINAEVLTFNRMAYRVASQTKGVTKTTLSDAGKSMLIYDILSKNKNKLKFLGKSEQNIKLISTQITEFKKHEISTKMLENTIEKTEDKYLKYKMQDMLNVYKEFENNMEDKYIDENDKLTILANNLDDTDMFKNTIIYIDEFIGFTFQEYRIIEKLLKVAKQISITVCTDNLDLYTNQDTDLFYSNKNTADKLLYIARNNNIECEKTVFLDKIYRFKNAELEHLEKNIFKVPYTIYEKNVDNIELFLANNAYSEIENVAKQIIKLVRNENYRFKDIAIISENIDTYSSLCKVIFEKYDIKVFIDEKKDLNQNILVKYILSILEIFAKNWSHESMFNYIKTGLLDIENDEIYILENYCKKWGIKGSKWYKQEWNFKDETEENKNEINRIRELKDIIVNPLLKLKKSLSGTKTVEQISKSIYEFLIENNIDKKIQQKKQKLEQENLIEIAKDYELSWNILMEILDEIVLIFKEEKITFERYMEILKIGLKNSSLGKIPMYQDQVVLGDVDRTRSNEVKAIFIIGVNDGTFPNINTDEGFFNDVDRQDLKNNGIELAKGTIDNLYEENFNIYKAFTTPREKLFISYVSSNQDGASLRPSILITKMKKIFTQIVENSDIVNRKSEIITKTSTFDELIYNLRTFRDGGKIDNVWFEIFNYYMQDEEFKPKLENAIKALSYKNIPEKISNKNIQELYGNTLNTSVSKLEQYKSCPFSYYLKYGLKLSENDEFKIQAIDTGTFMHEVIDEFFNIVKQESINIKEIEDNEVYKIIEKIINEKLNLNKNYIFTSTQKYKILSMRLKNVITKSMKYIIESLKNSNFEVFGNEVEFKKGKEYEPIILDLENGKKVQITGKIDRIDLGKNANGKYMRIIDYKSSVKNIELNEVIAGLQIQLLTYLDATCKIEEMLPAGVLYFNLIDPIIKSEKRMTDEQIEEELKKKFKMQGLILADVNVVKMMDKKLETGSSSVIPAYIDKEGNLSSKRSNTITKEQFMKLQKYTNKIIKQISNEILSGDINLKPYYNIKNKKTPCTYCNYKAICQFKPGNCGNDYNYIGKLEKDEIFSKI